MALIIFSDIRKQLKGKEGLKGHNWSDFSGPLIIHQVNSPFQEKIPSN